MASGLLWFQGWLDKRWVVASLYAIIISIEVSSKLSILESLIRSCVI